MDKVDKLYVRPDRFNRVTYACLIILIMNVATSYYVVGRSNMSKDLRLGFNNQGKNCDYFSYQSINILITVF